MSSPEHQGDNDIRPLVAGPRNSRGIWIFVGGLIVGGLMLFQMLEARRTGITAPSTVAPLDNAHGSISSPPDLAIPPPALPAPRQYLVTPQPEFLGSIANSATVGRATTQVRHLRPVPAPIELPAFASPPQAIWELPPSLPASNGHSWSPDAPKPSAPDNLASASSKDRVRANWFANPATTVPKGSVIQAVLESALDSTRGGFARAIVSRDVYGFDGSKVLIERGSRIIGEYKSDVSAGQNRILIQWQRLMRPDGVIIELDSPSADPLGRAGVKGSVNSHFLERFGGAILQSTLDLGVQLAARAATRDTYVLALPGSLQQGTRVVQSDNIRPTVNIRQGSSVSVFVAKDLDFTEVEK